MNKTHRGSKKKLNIKTRVTSLDVARWFLQENESLLPSDLVRALSGAIRARDVPSIRRLATRFDVPQLYAHPSEYAVVAQVFALLLKVPYPFGGGDSQREEEALKKFFFTEKLCRITTRRLRHYWTYPDREDPVMRVVLTRARVLVDQVLGSVDNALPNIVNSVRFGPGMTLCSMDSSRTTPFYKLSAESWTVTATAKYYASLAILSSPQWVEQKGEIDISNQTVRLPWKTVQSCRLTFVPKDERTFRTIAIEPFGNVMVQLGVHSYLAMRLQKFAGINIHSQEWNQQAALRGSRDWLKVDTVSTIDLSSASDCVSLGLVERLVRPEWRAMLDDLRSKFYSYKDHEYELSKWSSMGNGYTFALETLLFWAIAQSCEEYCGTRQKSLVFGDDIVSSRQASLLVLQVLRYSGFRFNPSKTNVCGPFRESCGRDYHSGVIVRPVFQKKFCLEVPDVFVLMNTLGSGASFSSDLVFDRLLENLSEEYRLYGPPSENVDSYIHAPPWWLVLKRPRGYRYHRDHQCHYIRRLTFKPSKYKGDDRGKYLSWLYSTSGCRQASRDVFERAFRHRTNRRSDGSLVGAHAHNVYDGLFLEALNVLLRGPSSVQITQRSRGNYRFSSTRCQHFAGTMDRKFFLA